MAEEMQQIQSKSLRGYDVANDDGLWVEWSDSEGAWYVRVTLYENGVNEQSVVARYTFYLTNEDDDFLVHEHIFTEAVTGHTYTIGVKYYPEADSELWSESDETYTTLTYTGGNDPDPPPNFDVSTFKIRDKRPDGTIHEYLYHDSVTFVSNFSAYGFTYFKFRYKKTSESLWIDIETNVNNLYDNEYKWGVCETDDYYANWGYLTLLDLEPQTEYEYQVWGYSESDGSDLPTVPFAGTFTTKGQLAAPTGLAATDKTLNSITLGWNVVTYATGYEVVQTLNNVETTQIASRTSCTFSSLTEGTTYSYKVKALGDAVDYVDSDYCTPIDVVTQTQLAKPSIGAYPRASVSQGIRYTSLQIRLTKTITNATSYEYQIALDSNFTSGVLTRTSSTVSSGYPVSGYFTGLTSGTKYYCRARALSSNSDYATSEWSNVTNTVVTSVLPAPTNLNVTGIGLTESTLNWDAVENASGGYTVKYRLVGATDWTSRNVNA